MTTWILFDDPDSGVLRPLTWLRPASELRFGGERLEERWRRMVGSDPLHVVTRDELAPLHKGRFGWSETTQILGDTVWVRDRFVPTEASVAALRGLAPGEAATIRGVACAFRAVGTEPGAARQATHALGTIARLQSARPALHLDSGDFLSRLGDLVRVQEWLLGDDLERLLRVDRVGGGDGDHGTLGDGFAYERARIRLGDGVRIDHGAVLDARDGGIVLGAGCAVLPGAYLKGPMAAAENCLFLGGTIGSGSSFGPVCRVRGEVETTVFLGFSNKAHDGFVGHSYVGEWVNLGALTTTSDLKNDYGEVSLEVSGQRVRTGTNKIGTFFGDHAKTRIGCLFNTGTIVGLGANVFGNETLPEREIVDFQWGTGAIATEYRIEKFLQVARIVLGRRGVEWTPAYEAALRVAHAQSDSARAERLANA